MNTTSNWRHLVAKLNDDDDEHIDHDDEVIAGNCSGSCAKARRQWDGQPRWETHHHCHPNHDHNYDHHDHQYDRINQSPSSDIS